MPVCSPQAPRTGGEAHIFILCGLLDIFIPCGVGTLVYSAVYCRSSSLFVGILQLVLQPVGCVWSLIYGFMFISLGIRFSNKHRSYAIKSPSLSSAQSAPLLYVHPTTRFDQAYPTSPPPAYNSPRSKRETVTAALVDSPRGRSAPTSPRRGVDDHHGGKHRSSYPQGHNYCTSPRDLQSYGATNNATAAAVAQKFCAGNTAAHAGETPVPRVALCFSGVGSSLVHSADYGTPRISTCPPSPSCQSPPSPPLVQRPTHPHSSPPHGALNYRPTD